VSRIATCCVAAFCFTVACLSGARAASYPEKPVRLVALNPPGGVSDTVARALGEYMAEQFGQAFVVDNRVGGGGIIGSDIVAHAPADGYTLLLGFVGNLSINPGLYKKLPYDSLKDFAPISLAARSPQVVIANLTQPVKSIVDLIALAKGKQGELAYASSGVGNGNHLAAELFATEAGIRLLHVPYKGGPPALTAVIQNEAAFMFGNAAFAVPQVKAGRVRALAVTTEKRIALLPEVPTMIESGLPRFVVTTWFGLLAPAKTPTPIIGKLNQATVVALQDSRVDAKLDRAGLIASPSTPAEFQALIKAEIARWREVIERTGTRAN
jgi:tripartite-type tricarboxylate transporter receptor subunit TctC